MIYQNNSVGFKLLFFLLCLVPITWSQDLSVDEIVAKNIDARGGSATWAKVQSIKMTGTYVSFSIPEPFVIYKMRPDLYRFDSTRLHLFTIHAFDGKQAWWVNPLIDESFAKPSLIPTDKNLAKVTLRERYFEPVFWNYKEKGNKVELVGKEDMDGESVYHLKVTLKNKEEESWYISSDSFLAVSMSGTTYDFGLPNHYEVFFSDYRKVDGVVLPSLVESEYGIRYRTMEIKSVEINKGVTPEVFNMPDPETWKKP